MKGSNLLEDMVRKPESEGFWPKRAPENETQPKGWVFLLAEKEDRSGD